MKINALRVRSVGQFINGLAIENFSGELDVLVGANEFGKSTLFRALETVLTVSYSSASTAALAAITPYGGGSPVVEVDFEVEGRRLRLRKQYWGGARADLFNLDTQQAPLANRDAENALQTLLGGRETDWLRPMLFIAQGDIAGKSFEKALSGSATDIEGLVRHEMATATSDRQLDGMLEAVTRALAELATVATFKPKKNGGWWRAEAEVKSAEAALAEAQATQAMLAERLAELARLRTQLAALEDAHHSGRLAADVASAKDRVDAETLAEQRLRELDPIVKVAERAADDAEKDATLYALKLKQFANLTADRGAAAKTRAEAAAARDAARTTWSAADQHQQAVRAAFDRVAADLETAKAQQRAVSARTELNRLSALIERIRDTERQRNVLEHQFRDDPFTTDTLAQLRASERKLESLAAQRDATTRALAPTVDLTPEPSATLAMVVDGTTITHARSLSVERDVHIAIAGAGSIRISAPASQDLQTVIAAHAAALTSHQDRLRALAVRDVHAAETRTSQRSNIGLEIASLTNRVKELAPDGIAAIERNLAAAQAKLAAAPHVDEAAMADLAALEAEFAGLHRAQQAATDAVMQARIDLDTKESAARDAERHWDRLEQQRQELETDLGPEPDRQRRLNDKLARQSATAAEAREHRRDCDAWRAQVPTAQARHSSQTALAQAKAAFDDNARLRAGAREAISSQEGAIAALTLTDPDADLSDAKQRLEQARKTLWLMEREARALDLIRRSASDLAAEQQDRIVAPLIQRISSSLQSIIRASGALALTPSLTLGTLTRDGKAEPVDRLSTGTQEQLALLVRLGLAELSADAGRPMPVVLDDTLVHADRERLAAIIVDLKRRTARHQVIVFSCRDDAPFADHGRVLEPRPWGGA